MKTIYTLSTLVLIALSLNSFADDKLKNKEKSVSVAPFIWGDPENEAPAELGTLKAKNALVPVAPFIWGSPEDSVTIEENERLAVPVAPFIYGDADSDAPEGLEFVKAKSGVPVAPFVWGNSEEEAPIL